MRSKGISMQADALVARAHRLLSDHRTRAKRDGTALDYSLADVRQLLADNPLCESCRTPLSFAASLDHRQPIAGGGRHTIGNLAMACERCNRMKGPRDTRLTPTATQGERSQPETRGKG